MNIFVGSSMSDEKRRSHLYAGDIFVHAPSEGARKLCKLAQEMIEAAFGPDPCAIQRSISAERAAELLSLLKPKFIHDLKSKEYIQQLLIESGCDPQKTYFDVPRLRTAFPGDYLKSGIAYAFHPHRDTWYSAPLCQVNWWMPVYPIDPGNSMAIHPRYWGQPIRNSSNGYNYHRWNLESRHAAAQHVKTDTRVQPKAEEEVELEHQIRLLCEPAAAYQFSAAHLHSTVPNALAFTRYSIDFRTVHLDDVLSRTGAPNIDSACTGTSMGDFLKVTDFSPLPADALALYQDGSEREFAPPVRVG